MGSLRTPKLKTTLGHGVSEDPNKKSTLGHGVSGNPKIQTTLLQGFNEESVVRLKAYNWDLFAFKSAKSAESLHIVIQN